ALWPSLRATLIQPLDAMRKNDPEAQRRARGITRFSPHLGALLLCFFAVSTLNNWGVSNAILGWVDQASAMIGAALLGPAVVVWLIRLTAPIAIPLGGAVTRLADDNLMRNPRRTGSNVMSLMVGLILVIMIAAVNVSFRDTVLGWFNEAFRYDLLVSSTGRVISFQTQPVHEDLGRELVTVPGLKKSAHAMRFIHVEYQGRRIGLKAFDPPDPAFGFSTIPVIDRPKNDAGNELFGSTDPTVLVSSNFVLHFGLKRGDTVRLATPEGVVPFRIIGVVDDYASAEGVLYVKRTTYKKYWNDPLVSVFAINLAPGADLETVRQEIDRRFGQSRNLMAVSNQEFRKQMADIVDQSFAYTDAIKLAALLVGLLGLFNTFLISVMERTRELGMLRAVGMSRAQMRSMILVEAFIQGAFGALAATALGAMISFLWIKGNLAHILGWIIRFHFPWMGVLTTVAIGVFVALLAGLFPAWRASHLEIREALEYE
ncbi:MAG TPA: FtsX-like permease family protein, partial [Bdellovibrionota bacterium]|nr:FtsX-like permease family protein [Bdellovibrionota bacterium]